MGIVKLTCAVTVIVSAKTARIEHFQCYPEITSLRVNGRLLAVMDKQPLAFFCAERVARLGCVCWQ